MSENYQVSSAPHVRAKDSTSRVMLYVIIALLPASLFGVGYVQVTSMAETREKQETAIRSIPLA